MFDYKLALTSCLISPQTKAFTYFAITFESETTPEVFLTVELARLEQTPHGLFLIRCRGLTQEAFLVEAST